MDCYDFILFKSMLGGIGRIGSGKLQMDVMRQVHKSLKKGGEVLFIENMRGAFIHQMYRKRYGATRIGWCYPSLSDFIKMSKIFSKVKYEPFGVLGSSGNLLIKVRTAFDLKFEKENLVRLEQEKNKTKDDRNIKNKIKIVEAGAQGEHKLQRGYMPQKIWSLHWIKDQQFSKAIEQYLDEETKLLNNQKVTKCQKLMHYLLPHLQD